MARTLARLDPETLVFGHPSPAEAQISPDGTRLVYVLQSADPAVPGQLRSRLCTCAFDGSSAAPLTAGDESVAQSGARWAPDGASIAYAAEVD
ncbi:MAG TPA: hypothetical protein VIO84_11065, partial [Candidatus Dormibacteraeota bacterium]